MRFLNQVVRDMYGLFLSVALSALGYGVYTVEFWLILVTTVFLVEIREEKKMINPDNFEDDDKTPDIWLWCVSIVGTLTIVWAIVDAVNG
jgi:hypothetical protein